MDAERQKRRDEVLEEAIALDSEQCAAFLDGVCGEDSALRRELEQLLRLDRQTQPGFLEAGAAAWLPRPLTRGQSLGRYVVDELIGSGGMSAVYRAHDPGIGRSVAIKVLLPSGQDAERARRFVAELRILGTLRHDHVVRVYDFGEVQGLLYIVTELLEGEDLARAIAAERCGAFAIRLGIAQQLATALKDLHAAGIMHRDVKPANVFIESSGRVKLMDFGIARAEGLHATRAGMLCGTPEYLSPEQIKGQPATTLSDIYSYGVLLVELFTGTRPYEGTTVEVLYRIVHEPIDLSPLRATLPQSLMDVIERATAKEPGHRISSFAAIESMLTQAMGGENPSTARSGVLAFEGQPQWLRLRLQSGPLPVQTATKYASQIARELARAHEQGITHGHLTPNHILVANDDRVTVPDFASAIRSAGLEHANDGLSGAAVTGQQTPPGRPLETLGYQAPEQLDGRAIDHRVDVFALGAVLYEMLSGERAFTGKTTTQIRAAILSSEAVDLSALNQDCPLLLRRIVERCLEKQPADRFQSGLDLSFALESVSLVVDPRDVPAATQSQSRSRPGDGAVSRHPGPRTWAIVVAVLLFASVLVAAVLFQRDGPATTPGATITSSLMVNGTVGVGSPVDQMALSPNGRWIAYVAEGEGGRQQVWIRSLADGISRALPGTQSAMAPFWSPDSRSVGFYHSDYNMGDPRDAGGLRLKTIDIDGGLAFTVCSVPRGIEGPPTWNRNGTILLATGSPLVIHQVSATGGVPMPVTAIDPERGETAHTHPLWLPDGNSFLYVARGHSGGPVGISGVYLGTVASNERTLVLRHGSNVQFGNGRILFMDGQALMAQPFDFTRRQLTGPAVRIANGLAMGGPSGGGIGAFSASDNGGLLAYVLGSSWVPTRLLWFDRRGVQLGILGDDAWFKDVYLSPDGSHAATEITDGTSGDVWLFDVLRGVRSRMTFDASNEGGAVWSADERRLVITIARDPSTSDLYERSLDGIGPPTLLLADATLKWPLSWSRDERYLLFERMDLLAGQAGADIWVLSVRDRKAYPFLNTRFDEAAATFSPDGHFVAYRSDESGSKEVYVTSFPTPKNTFRVSTAGGDWPRWRGDGRELFYIAPNGEVMAAPIRRGDSAVEVKPPTLLFRTSLEAGSDHPYDVTADGQRFLVNTGVRNGGTTMVTLVTNWLHSAETRQP